MPSTHGHLTNSKNGLVCVTIGTAGTFGQEIVPAATWTDAAASSASAGTSSSQHPTFPAALPWIVNRFSLVDLNGGPVANYFR